MNTPILRESTHPVCIMSAESLALENLELRERVLVLGELLHAALDVANQGSRRYDELTERYQRLLDRLRDDREGQDATSSLLRHRRPAA